MAHLVEISVRYIGIEIASISVKMALIALKWLPLALKWLLFASQLLLFALKWLFLALKWHLVDQFLPCCGEDKHVLLAGFKRGLKGFITGFQRVSSSRVSILTASPYLPYRPR